MTSLSKVYFPEVGKWTFCIAVPIAVVSFIKAELVWQAEGVFIFCYHGVLFLISFLLAWKLGEKTNNPTRADMAIVGYACRFGEGAEDVDKFWDLLQNGKDCMQSFPQERLVIENWSSLVNTTKGSFVANFKAFDRHKFRMSEDDAGSMDPQLRLLLQCSYHAFEHAGVPPEFLHGSRTGVFVGMMNRDYEQCIHENEVVQTTSIFSATSMMANQISYHFGLLGESKVVDTACSSSMTALLEACRAMKQHSCEAALCAGVNITFGPKMWVSLSQSKMLSPTGYSKPFSREADGYARGEGVVAVVILPHESITNSAKTFNGFQGDFNVHGIIRGIDANSSGCTATPITKPSKSQQVALMRQVHEDADVLPDQIQYFEAHGTGTPQGDPIEWSGIQQIFEGGSRAEPLHIGSVKGNIGHTEGASGLASLVKILEMMRHGKIAKSLHWSPSTSSVPLSEELKVPTDMIDWPCSKNGTRIACLNSFGFGGANCHAVIEQPERQKVASTRKCTHLSLLSRCWNWLDGRKTMRKDNTIFTPYVIPFSAATADSLHQTIMHTGKMLGESGNSLKNLSKTCAFHRTHKEHSFRKVFQASTLEDLQKSIKHHIDNPSDLRMGTALQVCFVFTGNGKQGNILALIRRERAFRNTFHKISKKFGKLDKTIDLIQYVEKGMPESKVRVTQAYIFAVGVSMYDLMKSLGIIAKAHIGHSIGEVAAFHCAGACSLQDAVEIVYHRGKLQEEVSGGGMLAVFDQPYQDVPRVSGTSLAALNSPIGCTFSGRKQNLANLQSEIEDGKSVMLQNVDAAYHSQYMNPILEKLKHALKNSKFLKQSNPQVKIYSTVTGKLLDIGDHDIVPSQYWSDNVRKPVLFGPAVDEFLKDSGKDTCVFLELGSNSQLCKHIEDTAKMAAPECTVHALPTAKRDKEHITTRDSVCRLFELGINIDFSALCGPPTVPDRFPMYQFQEEQHWLPLKRCQEESFHGPTFHNRVFPHPFLAKSQNSDRLICPLLKKLVPTVFEHTFDDKVLVPAALYVEIGIMAAASTLSTSPLLVSMKHMHIIEGCVLNESNGPKHLVVSTTKSRSDCVTFTVMTDNDVLCATGELWDGSNTTQVSACWEDLKGIRNCMQEVRQIPSEDLYSTLKTWGLQYGPQLARVCSCKYDLQNHIGTAKVPLPSELRRTSHQRPVMFEVIDYVLQAMAMEMHVSEMDIEQALPVGIEEIQVRRAPYDDDLSIDVRLMGKFHHNYFFSGSVSDSSGEFLVLSNACFEVKEKKEKKPALPDLLWDVVWSPVQAREFLDDKNLLHGDWATFETRKDLMDDLLDEALPNGAKLPRRMMVPVPLNEAEVQSWFLAQNLEFDKLQQVVFVVDAPSGSSGAEALQELYKEMMAQLLLFICLIKAVSKEQVNVPVRIVTRGSPLLSSSEGPMGAGYAFWGMVRTLLVEQVHKTLQIIELGSWGSDERAALRSELAAPPRFDCAEIVITSRLPAHARSLAAYEEIGTKIVWSLGVYPADWEAKQLYGKEAPQTMRSGATKYHQVLHNGTSTPRTPRRLEETGNARFEDTCAHSTFRGDGTYIVTGGLTGFGLLLGCQLAKWGAGKVVLLGRRQLGDLQHSEQNEIRSALQAHVTLEVAKADVCDLDSLDQFFQKTSNVCGVCHSAAVFKDRVFNSLTLEDFEAVMAPKAKGAINLHTCFQRHDCVTDLFLLISSVVVPVGNVGQVNYAAANGFLDSFAHWRNQRGHVAQSINWSGMDIGVLQGQEQTKKDLLERGLSILDVPSIMFALDAALRIGRDKPGRSPLIIAAFDWHAMHESVIASNVLARNRFEKVIEDYEIFGEGGTSAMISTEPADMEVYIFDILKDILGKTIPSADTELESEGLHSMNTMQLRNRIFRELAVDIPSQWLLNSQRPTVQDLINKVGGALAVKSSSRAVSGSDVVAPASSGRLNWSFPLEENELQ